MSNKQGLYRLSSKKYIYTYADCYSASLADLEIPTLYKRSYTLKQALIYMKRDIAKRLYCKPYDIDIDPSDIEILEN